MGGPEQDVGTWLEIGEGNLRFNEEKAKTV